MWIKNIGAASLAVLMVAVTGFYTPANAQAPDLGSAKSFAVLGATTVTNTGATSVTGDVGVSPGTAVTGFSAGTVMQGSIYAGGPVAAQAEADLAVAYSDLAGRASLPSNNLSGQDLGGLTLSPAVYHFNTSANLGAPLILDANGDPDAIFIFQIGTTLITGANTAVNLRGGARANNVYWQVGSSATLGTATNFQGSILAYTSITLTHGANVVGRTMAENGAVTMDTNMVLGKTWEALDVSGGGSDNVAHILWYNTGGSAALWNVDSSFNVTSSPGFGPYAGWTPRHIATGSDNFTRILWTNTSGAAAIWYVNDTNFQWTSSPAFGPYPGWTAVDMAAGSDGYSHILWSTATGQAAMWNVGPYPSFNMVSSSEFGPYSGWAPSKLSMVSDNTMRLLWTNTNGQAALWNMDSGFNWTSSPAFGPYVGWKAVDVAGVAQVDGYVPDQDVHILWYKSDGQSAIWNVDSNWNSVSSSGYGPYSGWTALAMAECADGGERMLWTNTNRQAAVWNVDAGFNFLSGPSYGPY